MTNDRNDEAPAGPPDERPKRPGPTIDLDASEVSGDTHASRTQSGAAQSGPGLLSSLAAPLGGAVAALLVLAVAWALGVIGPRGAAEPAVSPAQLETVTANVGDLAARVRRVEVAASRPPAPAPAADSVLAERTDALERSLAATREEIGKMNAQLRTVTTALNDLQAAPRDGVSVVTPPPDLAPLTDRLAQVENVTRALASEVRKPNAAAQDVNVRRLLVANTLDAAVRRGEPFAAALAAAKQLSADPNALTPLDAFAAGGLPDEARYLREIVPVLQRISDNSTAKAKAADAERAPPSGANVLERLQSGLFNLVRIERDTGEPAGAPAKTPSEVRRHDLASTRRDVANLPQAADPQVQAWIKSVDARAAALAAAEKFSAEALAAFGKSGQ